MKDYIKFSCYSFFPYCHRALANPINNLFWLLVFVLYVKRKN